MVWLSRVTKSSLLLREPGTVCRRRRGDRGERWRRGLPSRPSALSLSGPQVVPGGTSRTQGRCMARGRTTALTITLTPEERQTLLAWQRSTAIRAGLLRRAQIILLLADGVAITDIAVRVGISRRFVYKWVQRFLEQRVAGLTDKPGRGGRVGAYRARGPHRSRTPRPWDNALAVHAARARSGVLAEGGGRHHDRSPE